MTSSPNFTLNDFFKPASGDLVESLAERLRKNRDLRKSGDALAAQVKSVQWGMLAGSLAKKLTEILNMPLADILIKAWMEMRESRQPADEAAELSGPRPAVCPACRTHSTTDEQFCHECGAPLVAEDGALAGDLVSNAESEGETKLLPLVEHNITSEHSPAVELLRDGRPIAKVTFDVMLTLVIEGALLEIRAGMIEEIRLGQVKGQGSISCSSVPILEKKLEPVPVPGAIRIARDKVPRHTAAGA